MTGSAMLLAAALLALPAGEGGPGVPPQGEPPGDAPVAAGEGATHHHGLRELLDVLEPVDTPVRSRNQLQLKYEVRR